MNSVRQLSVGDLREIRNPFGIRKGTVIEGNTVKQTKFTKFKIYNKNKNTKNILKTVFSQKLLLLLGGQNWTF